MNIDQEIIREQIVLRKRLHRNPELSGGENNTASIIHDFIKKFQPDEVLTEIGGSGLAVIYSGNQPGPVLMFRCELDALPIAEINTFEHASVVENVSHKCGHDGHMAIVAGLAPLLFTKRPSKGKVILLFQPAEETGQGARAVIADKKFKGIAPDFVFALHNLPGYPLKNILIKEGAFASASKGMIIKLSGLTSHAAHPENGNSPAMAMAEIISQLNGLPAEIKSESFKLVTVVYARLGEVAFGTSPGDAEVMATLRSFDNEDMHKMVVKGEELVRCISEKYKLKFTIAYTEKFPATENNSTAIKLVKEAAEKLGYPIQMV